MHSVAETQTEQIKPPNTRDIPPELGAAILGLSESRTGGEHSEVMDPYEHAKVLRSARGLDVLIRDFDGGFTSTRDVTGLTTGQRDRILEVMSGPDLLSTTDTGLFRVAASRLRAGMLNGFGNEHPLHVDGWNFLVNMQGFMRAGMTWAKRFDACFVDKYGAGVDSLIQELKSNEQLREGAHLVVADIAGDEKYLRETGGYLAARSSISERYQESQHLHELRHAKAITGHQLDTLGKKMGLNNETLQRSKAQLSRVQYSGFDHLIGGVIDGQSGAAGHYLARTLRVQVNYSGTGPRDAKKRENADEVVQHEVEHAVSAQDADSKIIGLFVMNEESTRQINEGMTQFLTEHAHGFPNITFPDQRNAFHVGDIVYRDEVIRMAVLYHYDPGTFAELYRAYHGQIDNEKALGEALSAHNQLP